MVKRGISEDQDYDEWCDYIDPAVSKVFQKTIGCRNGACSWRTENSLWCRSVDGYHEWSFKNYEELTDADIKEFCRVHDIMELVSAEVYSESKLKVDVATEVEFMDI